MLFGGGNLIDSYSPGFVTANKNCILY
jgi:hypothetical protein